MKSILYSVCVGGVALALTAVGAQAATDRRPERAKPQQRTTKVQAARPANPGRAMSAHRNVSAAQHQQRSYVKPRTSLKCCGQTQHRIARGSRTKPRQERTDA